MAWEPPVGIPMVPAGLEPDQVTPAQPGNWPGAEQAGYYYVDNTHGSATDSGNAYGYPNLPRLTLPGSVTFTRIEIKGGGSNYACSARTWTGTGSQGSMVAIVGIGAPVLAGAAGGSIQLKVAGAWMLIEGVVLNDLGIDGNGVNFDNALVRNVTSQNWTGSTTRAMFSFGYRGTGQSAYNENIVVYDTVVQDIGDLESEVESDNLGSAAGDGSRNHWYVDNHWHHVAGDSIRTGTNVGGGHEPNRAENIYVGRNHFHDNFENGIDVKNSVNLVISQNEIHGFVPSVSSAGEAIVIHEQAENTLIVGNIVHDCGVGVSPSAGGQVNVWIIGNVFYNIDGDGDPDVLSTQGTAVNWSALTGASVTVGNTFHDNDRDINVEASSVTADLVIANNLFLGTKSTGAHVGFESGTASLLSDDCLIENNFFPSGGASAVLQQLSTQYETLAAVETAFAGKFVDCLEGNAATAVTNAAGRDYTLTSGSGARDVGGADPAGVYAAAAAEFGESLTFDLLGVARPQGSGWDIGAYEFDEGAAPPSGRVRSGRVAGLL